MPTRLRHALAAISAMLILATPCGAQQRAGLMGDLLKDVGEVQAKLVSLAKEMPVEKHEWRPGPGVRSVSEVFLHVAADNYLMPSAVGVQPDAATGIRTTDFSSVAAFEKQKMTRDAMVAALEQSFAHLTKAMSDTPDARLDDRVKFFGYDMSVRQVWVMTTTHLHEHLGQAIAYARTNGVVPPWSQKGS
jgi:uncharacterized damage-inducible protein DinB